VGYNGAHMRWQTIFFPVAVYDFHPIEWVSS
jgi:hypothetical protein